MEKCNGFYISDEEFETLTRNINYLGRSIDDVRKIYSLLHKVNLENVKDEDLHKNVISLTNFQVEKLRDFLDEIFGVHSSLLENIWTGIDEIDNKRYFTFYE